MDQPKVPSCDVCGVRREGGEVNHWWVLTSTYDVLVEIDTLMLRPWSESAEFANAAHACGQEHVHALISRFMDHGDFTDKPVEKNDQPV